MDAYGSQSKKSCNECIRHYQYRFADIGESGSFAVDGVACDGAGKYRLGLWDEYGDGSFDALVDRVDLPAGNDRGRGVFDPVMLFTASEGHLDCEYLIVCLRGCAIRCHKSFYLVLKYAPGSC